MPDDLTFTDKLRVRAVAGVGVIISPEQARYFARMIEREQRVSHALDQITIDLANRKATQDRLDRITERAVWLMLYAASLGSAAGIAEVLRSLL